MQKYATVKELAATLRVTRHTAAKLVREGRIPGLKVGRLYRVPVDGLNALRIGCTIAPMPTQANNDKRGT